MVVPESEEEMPWCTFTLVAFAHFKTGPVAPSSSRTCCRGSCCPTGQNFLGKCPSKTSVSIIGSQENCSFFLCFSAAGVA